MASWAAAQHVRALAHVGLVEAWDDGVEGVAVTANNAEHVEYPGGGELSVEELARRKDVRPVESVHDMARPDLFESDEELDAFLAHLLASRRADLT
jgi:hypothetical protein